MMMKILLLVVAIGGLLIVFAINWFWRWLVIPIAGIVAFDVITWYLDQRKKQKNP